MKRQVFTAAHPQHSEHAALSRTGVPTDANQIRVLVVDDEEQIVWSLSQTISAAGRNFRVGTATSAEEALLLLNRTHVDVLVTDLRLPKMDGLSLIETVRSRWPHIRTILTTAYGTPDIFQRARELDGFAYLEKPFSVNALLSYLQADSNSSCQRTVCSSLPELPIGKVLRLATHCNEPVVVEAATDHGTGFMLAFEGAICDVRLGPLRDAEALFRILTTAHSVEFRFGEAAASRRLARSSEPSLHVTAEMLDEVLAASTPLQLLGTLRRLESLHTRTVTDSGAFRLERSVVAPAPKKEAPMAADQTKQHVDDGDDLTLHPEDVATRNSGPKTLEEFTFRDLLIQSDRVQDNPYRRAAEDAERDQKVTELVNAGINFFREHQLDKARQCWMTALKHDPSCKPAQRNLEILRSVLNPKTC
ncbi:MAG: response regulator, partial [Bdellovibrionales bacterium]|nr:response regulator [Bdellovibrionales bacterium]